MSVGMTTFHDLTWRYTSGSYGQRWSLDRDFVKTYLKLDGSRHTATGEFRPRSKRDYRLSQSIITPGYTKLVGGVSTRDTPDFTVTLDPATRSSSSTSTIRHIRVGISGFLPTRCPSHALYCPTTPRQSAEGRIQHDIWE